MSQHRQLHPKKTGTQILVSLWFSLDQSMWYAMKKLSALLLLFFVIAGFQLSAGFEGSYRDCQGRPLELIARFLPEDPVIFEAGGHYGTDTINFVKRWPKSKIISFEPNPHAFELFLETTSGCPQIVGYNLAVADFNGTATYYVCYGTNGDEPIFEGASSLLEPAEGMEIHYQGPRIEVPCVVLDDWCKEDQVDHIDFMWLGLEGMELQVLMSSPEILDTVKVIYTQTNFYEFRVHMTQYKDLREFLKKNGLQASFTLV
jgi:2-O-methyltransferase